MTFNKIYLFCFCLLFAFCFKLLYGVDQVIKKEDTNQLNLPKIGLVELPHFFGLPDLFGPPGARLPFDKRPVKIYASPDEKSKLIGVITEKDDLELMTHRPEEVSSVCYDLRKGWYLIGVFLNNKHAKAWVSPKDAGTFRSTADLVEKGPTYVTKNWDGLLFDKAGAQKPSQQIKNLLKMFKVVILNKETSGNQLWFQVELFEIDGESCSDKVSAEGWVPLYTNKGKLNLKYSFIGC